MDLFIIIILLPVFLVDLYKSLIYRVFPFAGVQKAFGGLASTPDLAKKYSKKAVDQVKQSLK